MTRRSHRILILAGLMAGLAAAAHAQDTPPEGMSPQDWENFKLRYPRPTTPQPPPPVAHDLTPPSGDEYEVTETYPGSGITSSVMTRTADPSRWFVDGQTYRHAYGFTARVDGIALRQFGDRWFWCHRLVITDSPGDPVVGRVLYARLFAPRAPWEPVTD
jgi:hypothetical protein